MAVDKFGKDVLPEGSVSRKGISKELDKCFYKASITDGWKIKERKYRKSQSCEGC